MTRTFEDEMAELDRITGIRIVVPVKETDPAQLITVTADLKFPPHHFPQHQGPDADQERGFRQLVLLAMACALTLYLWRWLR